jgi:hypothetical protein
MSELTKMMDKLLAQDFPSLKIPKDLKNGDNIVAEKAGVKIVARGIDGRVVDWVAYDANGKQVATVVTRKPPTNHGRHPGFKEADGGEQRVLYQVCVCLEGPGEVCWWVECIDGKCASLT